MYSGLSSIMRTGLKNVQQGMRAGDFTCRQVVEYYLQNNHEKQHLNAFLEIFENESLEKADALDAKLKSGTETIF